MTRSAGAATLGVVCCYFNPCGYRSRLVNYYRFREGLERARVHLLTVELAFGDAPFEIEPNATELIQLRGHSVMWQKERLLNFGLQKLIADGFENLCYLDADILFDQADWVDRVTEALELHRMVQVFETVHRFGRDAPGAVSLLFAESPRVTPRRQGLGWAARRDLLQQTRLYENLVIGGADSLMLWAALRHARWAEFREQTESQFEKMKSLAGSPLARDIDRWAPGWSAAIDGDIGFAANRIVGLPHGPRDARQYGYRMEILRENGFDPARHLDGSAPAHEWADAPCELTEAIKAYFQTRDEDAAEPPLAEA